MDYSEPRHSRSLSSNSNLDWHDDNVEKAEEDGLRRQERQDQRWTFNGSSDASRVGAQKGSCLLGKCQKPVAVGNENKFVNHPMSTMNGLEKVRLGESTLDITRVGIGTPQSGPVPTGTFTGVHRTSRLRSRRFRKHWISE